MKTPQVPAMPGMTPLGLCKCGHGADACAHSGCASHLVNPLSVDQKTVAERKWQSRKLAPAPQKPCDVGLFSDDAKQLEIQLENDAINDALGGFDHYALGYRVSDKR